MADRWEASLEQIEAAAYRHLDLAVQELTPSDLQHAVHKGHMMRPLTRPEGWASSVILAGAEVVGRIFGPQDQIFLTPARNVLISLDIRTPDDVIADIALVLDQIDPHPLGLEPFRLVGGRLTWDGLVLVEDAL